MIAYAPQMQGSLSRTGFPPCNLLDIQTVNGDIFYLADRENISAPAVLTADGGSGEMNTYTPWLVSVPQIKFHRSLQTDTGAFVLQNLSGDTLSRDVEAIFTRTALEGAFFVWRFWDAGGEAAWRALHGTLSVSAVAIADARLDGEDMFGTSRDDATGLQYCETCQLVWGSNRCGVIIVAPGSEVSPYVSPPAPAITKLSSLETLPPPAIISAPAVPNYRPVGDPGNPGDPGGGGDPGSGGNPGGGTPPPVVTSSVECMYSFGTCQVPERILVVLNNFEKNYGESVTPMAGTVMNRQRKV